MSETDPAARAFEDLCAEMTVLRRSVEALPQAWRDNRPPDYTEDLARVVKAMNAVGARMEAIEANPTLKMTPQAYGQGIRQAGISASQEMQAAFQKAIGEVQGERRVLANIIGQSRQQDRQNWWLLGVGLACLVVGIGLSPVLEATPVVLPPLSRQEQIVELACAMQREEALLHRLHQTSQQIMTGLARDLLAG